MDEVMTAVGIDTLAGTAITTLAGTVAIVVGGYFGFLIVKKALRWAGRALG